MEQRNVTELITLDGNNLLARYPVSQALGRPVCLDVDLFKGVSAYTESALLYQIRQELGQDFSRDLFRHILLFVDFWEFFQYKDTGRSIQFEALLESGFTAQWADTGETARYVPFEKSQSQAKDCVISFIREDLFAPVRQRLDLNIHFGDCKRGVTREGFRLTQSVTQLSKLYAYRGLYLTEAVRLEGMEELLNENRIIVLEDIPITLSRGAANSAPIYTAAPAAPIRPGEKVTLSGILQENGAAEARFEPFDGVGLISPRGAALFNRALDPAGFSAAGMDPSTVTPQQLLERHMAVSFQFRLPFCKGMLHTVDFHRFLKQECGLPEDCWIRDIFGVRRNLKEADIILNQSLFKLWGLLRLRQTPTKGADFITHYFHQIQTYKHSIYIAKTDLQQRHTSWARLTAQIINTLPFTQEGFDRLVRRHCRRANQYRLEEILLREGNLPVLQEDSGDTLRKYIRANHYLALDSHVESLIDSCRRQALHDLYLGKLEVEGDMRFLSRDLIYFLHRIAKSCGVNQKFQLIPRGRVYMPGEPESRPCALFRSPHLCPNENVSAVTAAETDLHRRYLGHLRRVIFLGAYSQMPEALGGADFDGDMVVAAFQSEVVEACAKKCYREDGTGLPLLRIPALAPPMSTRPVGNYVDIQTIENTFNSQIGLISNAAMKICAAEAAESGVLPYPSQFCAILNGVEIDAAKTGVRPNLSKVVAFSGSGRFETDDDDSPASDSPARQAMTAVGTYLKVRKALKEHDLVGIRIREDGKYYVVQYGTQEIARFSREQAGKPFVFQLLCCWAQAFSGAPEEADPQTRKDLAISKLWQVLSGSPSGTQRNYPRQEVLTRLVFPGPDKFPRSQTAGVQAVLGGYATVKKALDTLQKNTDPSVRQAARKHLIYLLRYKYDDVDRTDGDRSTIRQLGNSIDAQLSTRITASAETANILENAFYGSGGDGIPWLRSTEEARRQWLSTLLDPATTRIAADFGAHGYDLMYYAFRELHSRLSDRELRARLHAPTEDPFLNSLYGAAAAAMERGYSASAIRSRVLPPLCRKQLEALTGETDPNVLIPLVYHHTKSGDRPVFWHLFSWDEIETYLKKVRPHAQ